MRTPKSEIEALKVFNEIYYKESSNLVFNIIMFLSFLIIFLIFYIYSAWIDNYVDTFLYEQNLLIGMYLGLLFLGLLFSIWFVIFTVLIKIVFTLKNFTYKFIPINWFKLILSVDICYPPELMPGIEKSEVSKTKFSLLLKKQKNILDTILVWSLALVLYLPTLIFRYSLKSTAWIYLPLIWLIQPQDRQNLTTRLKIESKNFIAYLMFFYSLIVVFVFTLLPLIFPHTELGVYLQTLAIPKELKTIFFAYNFNLWHLTRFLSALITIVFMVSFTKILIRRETEPSYGDFWGSKLLSLRAVRSVLTLITLGFTAYHILGLLPDGFLGELWANMKVFPE